MILENIVLETEEEILDMKNKMFVRDPFFMFGKEYVVTEMNIRLDYRPSTCTLRTVRRSIDNSTKRELK